MPPWADLTQVCRNLENRCFEQAFPKCFVAISDKEELLGTASLKLNELPNHPMKIHWLGEVYVKSELRGQGIGSLLVKALIAYAAKEGVHQLFLYTPDQQALYAKLGWIFVGSELVNNEHVSLMMYQTISQINEAAFPPKGLT